MTYTNLFKLESIRHVLIKSCACVYVRCCRRCWRFLLLFFLIKWRGKKEIYCINFTYAMCTYRQNSMIDHNYQWTSIIMIALLDYFYLFFSGAHDIGLSLRFKLFHMKSGCMRYRRHISIHRKVISYLKLKISGRIIRIVGCWNEAIVVVVDLMVNFLRCVIMLLIWFVDKISAAILIKLFLKGVIEK